MNKLHIEKDPKTGRLNIKGLAIWSTGTFHGYGSPAEGDQFGPEDLEAMARAHEEVGSKIRPRVYPGHKLNPLLKLLARPKGEIVKMYSDGNFLYADIQGVDPVFWEKAVADGARFSPDVKFGYTDPKTGKRYDKVVVGLGVLGAAHPANPELPALDDYMEHYYSAAYGDGEVRSYMSAPANMTQKQREESDAPSSVYLDPANKKYPVKRKKGDKWEYSLDDLKDAYRLAKMHGKNEIAEKAKGIMKREFGHAVGEEKETNPKSGDASYAAAMDKEEPMDPKDTVATGAGVEPEAQPVNAAAEDTNDARIAEIEERLAQYAAELEAEREARAKAEKEAAEAREVAEKAAAVLQAQMVENEVKQLHAFVDGLVEEMRVPPAAAEAVRKLLVAAAGVGGKVSSYALGDLEEDGDKLLVDLAKEAFSAFPAPENVTKSATEAANATATAGVNMRAYAHDPEAAKALREQIDAYRAENPDMSYADAFKAVVSKVVGE